MPQPAAVTFHCDEEPVVRVRELAFDDRVEVLVTFPQQHRGVVLFGDGPSIVSGLRSVADEVERALGLDRPGEADVRVDLTAPPPAVAGSAAEAEAAPA